MAKILLVDDEPSFQRYCSDLLVRAEHDVDLAANHTQIDHCLSTGQYDLVILDLALPPEFDPAFTLKRLPDFGDTPVIVITGNAERDLALSAMHLGAWDFIAKPVDPDMLMVVIERALVKQELSQAVQLLRAQLAEDQASETLGILGNHASVLAMRDLIRRIAPSDISVLITGQSGTGKELVARALHQCSQRAKGPFVPVHCGAIPAELIESELFGHVKGAFTGATQDRIGLLASANGGTVFLDEIGEMPLPMQVKLLRVLQDQCFYPVGGREQQQINIRVVSATHRDLETEIAEGRFREDLYYRIRGLQIVSPTLEERCEDIPLLVKAFLTGRELDNDGLKWLLTSQWPGNIRELKSTLETAAALAGDGTITVDDLQLAAGKSGIQDAQTSAASGATLDEQLRALEKRLVVAALAETDHNHTHAALKLGVSRAGLLKKLTKLGLR